MNINSLSLDNYVLYKGYTAQVQDIRRDKVRVSPIEKTGKALTHTGRYVEHGKLSGILITGGILQQMGFKQAKDARNIFVYSDDRTYYNINLNMVTTFSNENKLQNNVMLVPYVHYLQNIVLLNSGIKLEIVRL